MPERSTFSLSKSPVHSTHIFHVIRVKVQTHTAPNSSPATGDCWQRIGDDSAFTANRVLILTDSVSEMLFTN